MIKKVLLFVMILTVGFAFGGCKKKSKGVTDTEIIIGQWGPQTGPAALWGAVARGTDAYFKMINDEGGINGRKIKYLLRDDAYQPPKTKTEVKKLVEGDGVFAFVGGVGTAPGMAVKDYLAENKIPWVGPASGSTHWIVPPQRYLFSVYPLYCVEAAVLIDYAVKTMKLKKIAVFYQNDDYGKVGLYGAEVAIARHGLKLVEKVSVEIADTDLSSHILKLKNSGAEAVLLWVLPKHGAIILGSAAKVGFKPQFMTSSTLSDTEIMFQITKGLWKDMIICRFSEDVNSDKPLIKKYREAWKKYAPNERWGTFYFAGFLFAESLVEGMKRAGKDLNSETFVAAMESIKNFQGTGGKITFGPNVRQGTNEVNLAKVVSAKEEKQLTDWITSDINIDEVVKKLK